VIAPDTGDLERAAGQIEDIGGRARFLGVKMFSDGSLGGHTAAMHEGFADRPEERGTDRLDPDRAHRLADRALALGGKVAVHAIGDRANGAVLDLMERLIADGADPADLRVEHASVLTETDVARFGRLGVTASVQPAFIASETGWLAKRLGHDRLERTYPFRSLAQAGTPLAGGSDSPVEPPHPLPGIAAARDRCGIVPAESLDAAAALALFTTGAATAIGTDASLAPGSPADLAVLDTGPLTATPDDLRHARPVAVFSAGTRVGWDDGTVSWMS
jgi:predicted amidohydrolase YtcJ